MDPLQSLLSQFGITPDELAAASTPLGQRCAVYYLLARNTGDPNQAESLTNQIFESKQLAAEVLPYFISGIAVGLIGLSLVSLFRRR